MGTKVKTIEIADILALEVGGMVSVKTSARRNALMTNLTTRKLKKPDYKGRLYTSRKMGAAYCITRLK